MGIANCPTMSGQFAIKHSEEVGDFKSSALPDTDKLSLLSEQSE